MGIAILILIVALIIGGIGLLVEALELLLWIGLILLAVGAFTWYRSRQNA